MSNGKIERFHRTIKTEAVRRQCYLSKEDARQQFGSYIEAYINVRLHSAIYNMTPEDMFNGKV